MKIGVYMPTHRNPMFLRMALMQMALQTRLPDVIAVCQNNQDESGEWAVHDIIEYLEGHGTKVLLYHMKEKLQNPMFYLVPLQLLINEGCDVFLKIDHDDLFFREHVERMVAQLDESCDYVINTAAFMLTLPFGGDFVYKLTSNFDTNPLGGMSDCICFNRALAEAYAEDMKQHIGKADDAILYDYTLPRFRVKKITRTPTACYVSHGSNLTTSEWARVEFKKQTGIEINASVSV